MTECAHPKSLLALVKRVFDIEINVSGSVNAILSGHNSKFRRPTLVDVE
jgi:hypothetical protein